MKKIQLKCSSCGGKLVKEKNSEDVYICQYCKNREIISKETKLEFTKNVSIPTEYYKLLEEAERNILTEEFVSAVALIKKAQKIEKNDYLAWWLLVKAKILYNIRNREGTLREYYSFDKVFKEYRIAYNLAPADMKNGLEEEYKNLCEKASRIYNRTIEYLSPSFGKEKNIKVKRYIVTALLIICCLIMVIGSFIPEPQDVALSDALYFSIGIACFASIGFGCVLATIIKEDRIVTLVKQNKKTSFTELLNICRDRYEVLAVVTRLIKSNYLVGYKVERSNIIKVENVEENEQ